MSRPLRIGVDVGYIGMSAAEGLRHLYRETLSRMIRDNPQHHFTLLWSLPIRHAGELNELLRPNVDVVTLIDKALWRRVARRLGFLGPPRGVIRRVGRLDVLLWTEVTERSVRWLHRLPHLPKVVAIPDAIPVMLPEFVGEGFNRVLLAHCQRGAALGSRLLTLSEHAKQDLCRLAGFDVSKAAVVYPGHNFDGTGGPAPVGPLPADLAARIGGNPYLLTVGTLEPRKNHVRLFRVFAELTARPPLAGWKLVAVGREGWQYDPILAEAARTPGVILAGRRPHTELAALYRHAGAFAFPSLYEGFGLPVAEALSFGLPVLTSRTTSLPEVAGDAALLVDPESESELTIGLARVMGDEGLRATLRARAPAQAAQFSWDRAAREILEFLQQVAMMRAGE